MAALVSRFLKITTPQSLVASLGEITVCFQAVLSYGQETAASPPYLLYTGLRSWHGEPYFCGLSTVEEIDFRAPAQGTREAGSKETVGTFKAKDLIITPATVLKEKPDPTTLVFGTVFTDHMLTVEWSSEFGWEKPHIKPLQNLSLHPGSSALHYAVELFEGLKAFRGVDNKIRLFRPNLNMDRMYRSAMRAALPVFDKEELLECIQQLVKLDQEWVPYSTTASLYIRPTFIGTERFSLTPCLFLSHLQAVLSYGQEAAASPPYLLYTGLRSWHGEPYFCGLSTVEEIDFRAPAQGFLLVWAVYTVSLFRGKDWGKLQSPRRLLSIQMHFTVYLEREA